MLTASQARFLTYVRGGTCRFVDFAAEAFELARSADPKANTEMHAVWLKHFAGTAFEGDPKEFEKLAAEILLSRSVDSFQYYLADVIGWALWRRPSAAGLKAEAEHYSRDERIELDAAVRVVARQYAEKLSYRGFNALVNFIETTFGVCIIVEERTRLRLRRIIAVRNMIAHNHSIKNERFCRDVGEPAANIGQSVQPTLFEADDAAKDLEAFVQLVDRTLSLELSK